MKRKKPHQTLSVSVLNLAVCRKKLKSTWSSKLFLHSVLHR